MSAQSPIKAKKPRGKAVAKEPVTADKAAEFTSEHQEIERTLNKHRIGNFRVMFKDMTFQWSDGEKNRALQLSKANKLRADMDVRGVQRTNPAYRMSGVIDRNLLESSIYAPNAGPKAGPIPFDQVKDLNSNAEYPVIVMKGVDSPKIEMQSGQHRSHILKAFYQEEIEHWWIVTLYDSCSLLPATFCNCSYTLFRQSIPACE